jgi:hypothetical protein
MKKRIAYITIAGLVLLTLVTASLWAQQDSQNSDTQQTEKPEYAAEMETLAVMVKSMMDFSKRVEEAASADDIINACTRLTHNLELAGPKMRELTKAHPDWDSNPPEEVREPMSRYLDALVVYSEALQKVVTYVQDHPDNGELQKAYEELQSAIAAMNQG